MGAGHGSQDSPFPRVLKNLTTGSCWLLTPIATSETVHMLKSFAESRTKCLPISALLSWGHKSISNSLNKCSDFKGWWITYSSYGLHWEFFISENQAIFILVPKYRFKCLTLIYRFENIFSVCSFFSVCFAWLFRDAGILLDFRKIIIQHFMVNGQQATKSAKLTEL